MLQPRLLPLAVLSLAALWPQLVAGRQAFTVNEVATQNRRFFSGAELMRDTCLKYGRKVPEAVQRAIRLNAVPPGKTSVKTTPLFEDMEYVMPVDVGGQKFSLQLDTGSSDLWVFSTLQPAEQRSRRLPHKVYDPLRSGARRMKGHTWLIAYGDRSGAYGEVYVDRVTIEDLTVPKQAVGVATSVSRTFVQDGEVDGLLGLGFTQLNSITPNPQKTWFDNIRANLSAPLFATALRRRRAGSYDFGYIDSRKYVGNITWAPVDGEEGFWEFGVSGFAIGGAPVSKMNIRAIADTGTSLWYLPRPIADAYWARVPGARYNLLQAGWIFRCSSKLPDMTVVISGKRITVPGINMNYQSLMFGMCYGGIQRETGLDTSVFGDVFLKELYVIHEQPLVGQPRLGFAKLRS